MRYPILLLCLALKACAFSLAGGYERVFFWYAYLLDCDLNDGKPSTIATTCSNCRTFNGFIDWINGYEKPWTNVPGGSTPMGTMPVDETAAALDAHPGYQKTPGAKPTPLTGDVTFGRVVQGTYDRGAKGLQQLMQEVSGFVSTNYDKINSNPALASKFGAADKSVTRIVFTRSQARSDIMIQDLTAGRITDFPNVTPQTNDKTIRSENGAINTRLQFLDVAATIRANPGIDGKAFRDWAKNFGDDNHNGNIEEAKRARARICNRP